MFKIESGRKARLLKLPKYRIKVSQTCKQNYDCGKYEGMIAELDDNKPLPPFCEGCCCWIEEVEE